jgi:type I restriction enzyme S subunit
VGEWPEVRLGDLVSIKHGYAFDGQHFRSEPPGDILLSPGNFAIGGGFQESQRRYYTGAVPSEFVLEPGALLVTMTDLSKAGDTLGYPAFVPEAPAGTRYLHNQRLGKVVLRAGVPLEPEYLFYVMRHRSYRAEVLASATGTTVRHTSPSRIEAFRFRLPPLTEQRRIARILGALDDKIEVNRRMADTLRATAAEVYRDVSGNASTDALIGDVAEVIDCLHSKKPERRRTGRPLLQLDNIRGDGLLDMGDAYLIDESDYAVWISRIEAAPGDCIITNVGRVGAVAQIPTGVRAALGRNMTAVRCRGDFPYPTFILEALLSAAMREEIALRTDTGTILEALNVRSIPLLRLPRPGRSDLARFERVVRPIRARMEQALAESRALAAVRDTLLPGLLSGELEVAA